MNIIVRHMICLIVGVLTIDKYRLSMVDEIFIFSLLIYIARKYIVKCRYLGD